MRNEMPEVIETAYKNAIATLKDIQKAQLHLNPKNDLFETSNFSVAEYKTNKKYIG